MSRIASGISMVVAVATTFAGAAFLALYLLRWEWHRALIAGIILIVAEVALGGALILRRLRRLDTTRELPRERLTTRRRDIDLRWLDPPGDRYGVFIPLLLGGGMLVSGIAWLIERLAKGTTQTSSLPNQFGFIAMPRDPLLPRDDEVRVRGLPRADDEDLRRLLGPGGDSR